MPAPTAGPCAQWVTGADLDVACCADITTRNTAASVASIILYRLSGRQYPGACERTVRPCGVGCAGWGLWPAYRNHWWHAFQTSSGWEWPVTPAGVPLAGLCSGRCHLPSVVLPSPVQSVTQIVVDGAVLSPAAYRVAGYRSLQRLDGLRWPCTQRLNLDSGVGGDTGTWQVTFQYGRLPDAGGIAAAKEYGCEIAKHLCSAGAGECKLPERTRTVVRQGITFDIETPLDFLDGGKTGLAFVDSWLASCNPAKLARRATVRRFDA